MKKLVLALSAVAAFTGSAIAADLPARPYTKAAPVPYVPPPSFTGFWISGGFGYGMADFRHSESDFGSPFALESVRDDSAGKGWLGKIGLGYDYQFAGPFGNWVIGAFADADWSSIKGQFGINTNNVDGDIISASALTGQFKTDFSWAVGGRLGYVALPGLLTYFNGGYTQARFKGTGFVDTSDPTAPLASGIVLAKQTRSGWFLGGGTEYAVTQFPGLFWKNEVRFSEFENKNRALVCVDSTSTTCGFGPVLLQNSKIWDQKATTELVYRFNWGGPVVAKY